MRTETTCQTLHWRFQKHFHSSSDWSWKAELSLCPFVIWGNWSAFKISKPAPGRRTAPSVPLSPPARGWEERRGWTAPQGTFLKFQLGLKMWAKENETWNYYYTRMGFKQNAKSHKVLRFHSIVYDYSILSQLYTVLQEQNGVAGNWAGPHGTFQGQMPLNLHLPLVCGQV